MIDVDDCVVDETQIAQQYISARQHGWIGGDCLAATRCHQGHSKPM